MVLELSKVRDEDERESDEVHRSNTRRRLQLTSLLALAVSICVGVVAGTASAAPKGAFAVFSDCPTTVAEGCIYSKTESGEFVIGKQAVPITNPVYLQSGFSENPATGKLELIGAADGKTLSKTPENVPGGLLDFVNCKEISNFFERVACELVFELPAFGQSKIRLSLQLVRLMKSRSMWFPTHRQT